MSDLLSQFEQDCEAAGVPPTAALKAGSVHPTLWKKWKSGAVSPTLRNFEAARHGLESLTGAPEFNPAWVDGLSLDAGELAANEAASPPPPRRGRSSGAA